MWLNNINYADSKEQLIILSVPSAYFKDQIVQKVYTIIRDKLHELTDFEIEVEFIVSQKKKPEQNNPDKPVPNKIIIKKQKVIKPGNSILSKVYTFDNFVIGASNSFAANACMAISTKPGKSYNPCLLYGGVGLGKTHFIQSIGNSIVKNSNDLKVVYITAEKFTNDFNQNHPP